MKTIDSLHKIRNSKHLRGFKGVDGPTPIWLCESQIDKIPCDYSDPNTKWLIPAAGHGTHGIILYWRYMKGLSKIFIDSEERSRHILENMLYLNEINPWLCRQLSKQGFINVIEGDYLEYKTKMIFDCIVGNYPFHKQVGPENTEPIWDKFVLKSQSLLKYGGYHCPIHPSGWRNISGRFKIVQELLLSKKILHLSIYNEKDGLEVFNAETRFDYYISQNVPCDGSETTVRFQDGVVQNIVLDKMEFIPNGGIELLSLLIAKDDEEKVELIHDESSYAHRKKYMSKNESDEFIYPCVYTVNSEDQPRIWYSKINNKGHFGKSKVVWSNGRISSVGTFIDDNGEYGLMEYSSAIIDDNENLIKIKKALDSKEFRNLMELCAVGMLTINHKIVSTFRKNFWEEFINE
tara:strand:+ start:2353 stop:3567 length:1215 start_codon:yes stop_codon:yes gene_type:complete